MTLDMSSRTAAPLRRGSLLLSRGVLAGVIRARAASARARVSREAARSTARSTALSGVQRCPVARASSTGSAPRRHPSLQRPSFRQDARCGSIFPRLRPVVRPATPLPPRPEMSQTLGLHCKARRTREHLGTTRALATALGVDDAGRGTRSVPLALGRRLPHAPWCRAGGPSTLRWLECCTSCLAPRRQQLTLDVVRLNEESVAFASP